VTDPRRTRLRLAAQNGAVRALVNADSPEQAIRELLREVCENLGWMVGGFWSPSPHDGVIRLDTLWADPVADVAPFVEASRQTTFRRGEGMPGRVWESGEPAWVADAAVAPGFSRGEAARAAGLHGGFAVPVPLSSGRRGVLEFFTEQTLELDAELLETMAAVGGHLGQFVQRRQAEAALRASEERFRTFGSMVPDATFVIDASSQIVYVNEAVQRIFGYAPAELVGTPLTRLLPERHRGSHDEGLRRFLETGERHVPWEGVTMEGLRRDGTEVPLEITYGAFEKDGQRFFTGIARDVTERSRAEEQLRFQARLLDAVGEAVIATDLEGGILYWNAYAEHLYGWASSEVLGRDIEEVTPTEQSRDQARAVMDQLAEGRAWSGEITVRDRSGREFPVLVHSSPILGEDGRLMGIIGTSVEITDRQRREGGQRFLADAGRVLASSLDYSTTLRSVATLAVPYLGDWCLVHLREADGSGVSPVARVVPEEETAGADALEELLTREASLVDMALSGDTAVVGPSSEGPEPLRDEGLGELGLSGLLIVPLRARGAALGLITFASTHSGRRYDEVEIGVAEELARRAGLAIDNARLYQEAEEGNRAKADFLAVVSHELRTPLNAIAGYADLLAGRISGELNEAQGRHVERIKVGAGHLAHLIDEILSYARVEAGRESVRREASDVGSLARDAAVVIQPDATDKGLALEVEAPDRGPHLLTDAGKVRQILVNLLSNAVKYTEAGAVRIVVRPDEGGAVVEVQDTGIGIPPEDRERIFDAFWQAESPNTRTVGGTGLGLSVSRRLARLLDGDLEVGSEVGEGSTFTLRIPDLSL
jgi:PAS domain S-box-containing protein